MGNNITNLIKDIAHKGTVIQTCAAKVVHINTEENSLHNPGDAYTINVMRTDGAFIKNVRLKASIQDREQGVITIPKLNSWVLISIIDDIETRAFVTECAEVERTFVRFKNDDNQFLEIDSNANQLAVTFKATKESDGNDTGTTTPEYNAIAKIEMSSLGNETDNPKPSIVTSMYDENGNELSKNTVTGNHFETVLNTIDGDTIKERIKLNLTTDSAPEATLTFTGDDDAVKQNIVFDEEQTKISITDGYEATVTKDNASFIKENLTFEMTDKFKIAAGGTDLLAELKEFITEVSKIIVVQGTSPNVGALTAIQSRLNNLLNS